MSDVNRNVVNYTGLDLVYDACAKKGATPASHALSDIVAAIESISGGGGLVFYKIRKVPKPPFDPTIHYFDTSLESIMLTGVIPGE